jgi:hypothetical protein
MRTIQLFCGALLLGPAFGANADYSWELAGVFDHEEKDRARREPTGEFDTDLLFLSATHYFNPVAEGSGAGGRGHQRLFAARAVPFC